jgi:pyruvate dehydrogenase E2 component (dihydrolipoamide acetyltransferase)
MPQLGETVAEGKITKWFKAAGDAVKPGDNLFEIETDKTSMEVPSTTSGTLTEIRFGVGEVAKVGAVVAVIGGAGVAATTRSPPRKRGPRTKKNWIPACAGTSGLLRRRRHPYIPHPCRGLLRRWMLSTRSAHPNAIMVRRSLPAGRW